MTRMIAIGQVAQQYVDLLAAGNINSKCHNVEGKDDRLLSVVSRLQHARWMCEEIAQWSKEDNVPEFEMKAQRWLCFVQGVLWSNGLLTINQMREHNLSFLKNDDAQSA